MRSERERLENGFIMVLFYTRKQVQARYSIYVLLLLRLLLHLVASSMILSDDEYQFRF